MGRPNQTQERLDALLDGRPGEVTDDLAPLLAAAEALRAELAEFELDPEVVDRHLEQALDRPATVVTLPVRKAAVGGGLRRRLAAASLAAALLLVPATASAASSSALPGQALYPVKLAVEQFRLATVQWSPTREAQERAKLAAKRLAELNKLIELEMYRQVPPAIRALNKAVMAANVAVREAVAQEGRASELLAASNKLEAVKDAQLGELNELTTIMNQLPPDNQAAINLAVQESRAVAVSPPAVAPAPTATTAPAPNSTSVSPEPSTVATTQPEPTSPPAPSTEPQPSPTTSPPEPDPTTTTASPPAPTTTVGTGGAEGTPGAGGGLAGADGGSSPSSTLP